MQSSSHKILALITGFTVILSSACQSASSPETRNSATGGSIETFMPAHVRSIFRRSCEMCHGPDGRGITGVAPGLQRAQPRSIPAWEQYLRDPHNAHPGATTPPPVWLNEDELKAVADFLARLNPGEQTPTESPAAR